MPVPEVQHSLIKMQPRNLFKQKLTVYNLKIEEQAAAHADPWHHDR